MMMCGSASGEVLPSYIVYKSQKLWNTWTTNGPPGTCYNCSPSGWFNERLFQDWFKNLFLKLTSHKPGIKVLIGDNLSSHFSDEVLSLCKKHNIKFVCVPPNSTHLTQPLDIAFFGPMKAKWQQILREWRQTAHGQRFKILLKQEFPRLLKKLMGELLSTSEQNLRSGFEKCGIYPLNGDKMVDRLPHHQIRTLQMEQPFVALLRETRQNAVSNINGIRCQKKRKVILIKSITEDSNSDSNENEEVVDDPKIMTDPSIGAVSPEPLTKRGRLKKGWNIEDPMEGPSNLLVGLPENILKNDLSKIEVGTFVVVQYDFRVNKIAATRCYVGQIQTIFVNKFEVNFLQKYRNQNLVYHFPLKEDKDFIPNQQIRKILKPPTIYRGLHTFIEPPI